jgi:hypothetical protein
MQITPILAAPPAPRSQLIFGLLLAEESGAPIEALAQTCRMGPQALRELMDSARAGDFPRFKPAEGPRVPIPSDDRYDRGTVMGHRQEVLVKRWMRRVCRHLAKAGSIELAEVVSLLDEGGPDTAWGNMAVLRNKLKDLRIKLTHSGGTARSGWHLDSEAQQRLADIVAADWRVAV